MLFVGLGVCLKELTGLHPHLPGKTKTKRQFDVQLEELHSDTWGLPLCLLLILQAGQVGNTGGCRLLLFVSPRACWSWDLCKNL